jgi:hypothetical protein
MPNPGPVERFYDGALTNTQVLVSDKRASLCGLLYENDDAAVAYLQFWNAASTGAATGNPVWTVKCPATDGVALFPKKFPAQYFDKGIVVRAATTRTGSTAPGTAGAVTLYFNK